MTTTFFGSHALKEAVRARVLAHQRADQIVQGSYIKTDPDGDGRVIAGCFIGCSLHSGEHSEFPRLLGLPEWFAYLGEAIFERLPPGEHLTFPLEVYDATPVGLPWEELELRVRDRFLLWLLSELVLPVAGMNEGVVRRVIGLHERRQRGDEQTKEEWAAAARAAYTYARADYAAAAARAAYAAATATDYASAYAYAFAYAFAAAARAAADAATDRVGQPYYASAYASAVKRMRTKLVELLRACEPEDAPEQLPDTPEFAAWKARLSAEVQA